MGIVQIEGKDAAWFIGLIGLISGWFMAAFRMSRSLGKYEKTLVDTASRVDEHDEALLKIRREREDDIKSIRAIFSNEHGGQRFMTFADHENHCTLNSKTTLQEIAHLTKAIIDNTLQVSQMSEQIGALKIAVAVLQNSRNIDSGERNRRAGD